ncbi:hypothetical protein H4R19_002875 [Coemansia spiralis]|nr:hypothetical protein H4R19_002875 [Coemansia spiralis]
MAPMDSPASQDAQFYRPQHIHASPPAAFHLRPLAPHPPHSQPQHSQAVYGSHAPTAWVAAAADYRHHPYPPLHAAHAFPQSHGGAYGDGGSDVGVYAAPYHPHGQHHRSPIPQLPRRVRCTQACNHCHRRKARCVRNTLPDGSAVCDNCLREGIPCEWRASRRRGPKRRRNGSGSSRAHDSPPQDSPSPPPQEDCAPRPANAASLANLLNTTAAATAGGWSASSSNEDAGPAPPADDGDAESSSRGSQPPVARAPRPVHRSARHYVLPSLEWPRTLRAPECRGLVDRFMAVADVELREAVLAYYAYFYGFCPILHPSSLLRKVVEGTLSPLLEDALRATTSMFVARKLGCKIDADALFTRLVTAITIRAEAPTVDEVCAFQLASIGVSGLRGFVCFDALKSAVTSLLMQLNWHQVDRYNVLTAAHSWDDWVEAETKRRVFWINYKVDSHHASIAGRPPVIDEEQVFVRAPCSDAEWDELSRDHLAAHCCTGPHAAPHPSGPWTADPWGAASADDSAASDENASDDSSISSSSNSSASIIGRRRTAQQRPARRANGISCRTLVVSVQEEMSRTFRKITPYESFMARISTLQRDAKAAWVQQCSSSSGPLPEPPLLGDSPLFQRYDAELRQWKAEQVMAADLRDPSLLPWEASFFGSVRHRIFLVRVRCYCLNIYACGVTILLHSSNRRSFCAEAVAGTQQQPPSRAASQSPPAASPHPEPESRQGSEEAEEQAITRILNQTFGPTWCQGLVARDIEPASWDLSVSCAHQLADCLRSNRDIPLEFVDMVIPLFLFVAITVLLRQIRRCKAALADPTALSDADRRAWDDELHRSLRDAQVGWLAIRSMGSVWRVEGISKLLSNMHIDEVERAAEQLAAINL